MLSIRILPCSFTEASLSFHSFLSRILDYDGSGSLDAAEFVGGLLKAQLFGQSAT